MAVKTAEQIKNRAASTDKGFGGVKESQPSAQTPAKPSAYRVESANALAVANQRNNQELQQLLSSAIAAQQATAKQTALVVDALMSGEFLHQQINQELGAIQQQRQEAMPQFEVLTVEALLPSADQVIHDLRLLPA
ncbi:hypothetical protein [Phormidium tenue]|uniref:Uncharacterized protein n=1 Tax=Phormidium tenue NIES-30 TaxID=549789 RepID=A0A1U7IYF9_9CYAN|nr:hypothetical protein [Phormidium tenue]MBD2234882.1 hypothetical protein [Phormidium tenue FACHB-1052]OKH43622.1 hypothetical protein NIES30_24590 [Phormidium tenue NIES-30]